MRVLTKAVPALLNYARARGGAYNPLSAEKERLKNLSENERKVHSLNQATQHISALDEHAEGFFSKLLINLFKGADPRQIYNRLSENEEFSKLSTEEQQVKVEEARVGANANSRFNFAFNALQAVQMMAMARPTGFFDGLSAFGSAISMPFILGKASHLLTKLVPHEGAATLLNLVISFFGYPMAQGLWNKFVTPIAQGLDGNHEQNALPANLYGGGLTAAGLSA
jgi:hypothetical protein